MDFRRHKRLLLVCCTLFALAITATLTFAQSSPGGGVDDSNGIFQLEGNATTDSGICYELTSAGPLIMTPGPGNSCPTGFTFVPFGSQTQDWANVNAGGSSFTGLATTGIVSDVINSASDNIFAGGGSKDTNDITSWAWKTGKPQGKDDIEHAYAAAYTLPNGHTAIYFGLDRFDNSGDSTAGFWFLQDSTVGLVNTPGSTTCTTGSGCPFSGKHVDGDLLIVSDFSTGGAISTITVFKWVASLGTIQQVTSIPGALIGECNILTGNKDLCAIVNPVPGLTSPWGFTNKSGDTTFDHGEFLEGALDLNAIFTNVPCFTTFMAETRSSTSPTATLSDFSPPVSFPLCGMKVQKSCNGPGTVSADGSSVAYSWTVTVTNTGIGTLFDATVVDTLPDGTTQTTDLGTLAPKASTMETITFTATSSNVANPLSVTNTATAHAFTQPNSGGTEVFPTPNVPATASCQAVAARAITVEKHCDRTLGGPTLVSQGGFVVVNVPFTAQVCNASAANEEAVNNITLTDVPSATITPSSISSLAPGQCASVSGSYFPSAVDSNPMNGLIAGRYFFTDTLTASGTGVLSKKTIENSGAVSCPICPDSLCTNTPLP